MQPSYFINPVIEALPDASPEERADMIRRIAACVGDEAALRTILGIDPDEFRNFYPDMQPPNLSTEDTISTFITMFAKGKEKEVARQEMAAQESAAKEAAGAQAEPVIPVAPAYDYALMMEQEEDFTVEAGDVADSTSDAISSFLKAVPPKTPKMPRKVAPAAETREQPAAQPEAQPVAQQAATPAAPAESAELSEALLRVMVKNKNYRKALEIIQELSLNNPKKSVYFAIQTRFLEKLIENEARIAK